MKRTLSKKKGTGFTLIELLVVMAIISIVMGITVSSYRSFQGKQELTQVGKNMITYLRFAQSQAFGGVKDGACLTTETLVGWYVRFAGSTYTINSRCGLRLGSAPRTVTLPQGITVSVSPVSDILFQPINKNVVYVSDATANPLTLLPDTQVFIALTSSRTSESFIALVQKTGDISEVKTAPTAVPTPTPTPTPTASPTPTPACPQSGLAGYWKMDDAGPTTVSDSTINANNGTATNGPVANQPGKLGTAWNFDGVDDYIDVGNAASLNPANQITLAAWIKTTIISSSQKIIVKDNAGAGGPQQYFIRVQSGGMIRFEVGTSASNFLTTSAGVISANTWHHVVGTYDGSTMKIYVNGVLNTSSSISGTMSNNGVNTRIGIREDNVFPFNGVIDEVGIWNRALTGGFAGSDIDKLYNSGAGLTCP